MLLVGALPSKRCCEEDLEGKQSQTLTQLCRGDAVFALVNLGTSEPAQAGLASQPCFIRQVYLGMEYQPGQWVTGRSPRSPWQRVRSSHWHQGWLMAPRRWRIWHHFPPRQLGTSCAAAASEDTGPAASLGVRLFSPPALARNTSPSSAQPGASQLLQAANCRFNFGEGLEGLKLVAENRL